MIKLMIEVKHVGDLNLHLRILKQDDSYNSKNSKIYDSSILSIFCSIYPEFYPRGKYDTKEFRLTVWGNDKSRNDRVIDCSFPDQDELSLFLTELKKALRVINGSASRFNSEVSTGEDE